MTKIHIEWKRKGDKIRRFEQIFESVYEMQRWFESFFDTDQMNEQIEIIMWKEK